MTRVLHHFLPVWGLLKLEYHIQKRYTVANLMGFVHCLTVLVFFYFLSGVIENPLGIDSGYFPFVAVGIAVTRIYQGLCQGAPARLEEWKKLRVLDALFVTGKGRLRVLLFAGAPSLVFALGEGLALLGLGEWLSKGMFQWTPGQLLLALSMVVWLALTMAFLATLSVLRWRRFNLVASLGSLSALFLSGAYFPVTLLPTPLDSVASVLPLTLLLDCFRGALLGTYYVTDGFPSALLGVTLWCTALTAVATLAFKTIDRHGRRTHSHSHL